MAKRKNPKSEAEEPEPQQQQQTKKARKAFKGATGYNYGEDYYFRGGRPPSKTDWDAMSQEEREQIGLPTFDDWKAAAKSNRAGHSRGGGNWESQTGLAQALLDSGARSWDDVMRVANSMGYADAPDQGRALLRRLKMAFEGTADPSGRYHRGGGGWVDVGTSDLAKRGIPGAADYFGGGPSGIDAVIAGLGGGGELLWNRDNFSRQVAAGDWTEWPPGSGKFFNDPNNDPSQRVWVDGSGRPTAPPMEQPQVDYSKIASGQRIGDWLSGARTSQQQQQDYWQRASQATPYVPGSGGNTAPPTSNTNLTTAWGVPNTGTQGRQQPRQDTRRPVPSTPSSYQQQPQQPQQMISYNRPGNAFQGPTVFGQPRQRRNVWGL